MEALYNDLEGRKCAGCTGRAGTKIPPDTGGLQRPYKSAPTIVNRCRQKLFRGELATNLTILSGDTRLPTIPPRSQFPDVHGNEVPIDWQVR